MRSRSGLFENTGLGWTCVACGSGSTAADDASAPSPFSRGEGEGPSERTVAVMARWANEEKSALECRRCGKTDRIGGTDQEGHDGISDGKH